MNKHWVYGVILAIIIGLGVAFCFLYRTEGSGSEVALEAVAPQVSTFRTFYRAKVERINSEDVQTAGRLTQILQNAQVRFTSGPEKGQEVTLDYETTLEAQKLRQGETVVVAKPDNPEEIGGREYIIVDKYRLPSLAIFGAVFLALAAAFGRWRGITAIAGLAFSIFVLLYVIAPGILAGQNPVLLTLVSAGIIAVVSIFLAHGFNQRTGVAVISTLLTLGLAEILAWLAVRYTHLLGNGSEESFILQVSSIGAFDLRGLLLASIIIGTLGILDDVTTAQSAAVAEFHKTDSRLSMRQLYNKGMAIGREHIASLINTLVLAYAGAAFPLVLLILLASGQPAWTLLNSEFIAEEIIRTLVGSTALVLAVPLTTILAAWYFTKTPQASIEDQKIKEPHR